MELLRLLSETFLNSYFLSFLVIIIGILIISTKNIVLSRWHHTFDKTHFSGQVFFEEIERNIQERELPGGKRRTTHKEVVFIGANREYLRIYYEKMAFEICTAYIGKSCFVSWWFFEKQTFLRRLILRVPILRWFATTVTYYQVDSEDAFRDQIHECVMQAIDSMTGMTGSTLTEAERSIISLRNIMDR